MKPCIECKHYVPETRGFLSSTDARCAHPETRHVLDGSMRPLYQVRLLNWLDGDPFRSGGCCEPPGRYWESKT